MSVNKNPVPDTILVAIDGSLPSQMSAEAAVQIAKKMSLKVRGLYVVGARAILEGDHHSKNELALQSDSLPTTDLLKQFKYRGNKALDWLEELCYTWSVPVTTDILFGGVSEMITGEARQITFLAIGRRGNVHENDTDALGEHFKNVVSHLQAPILIGGKTPTKFKRVYIVLSDHNNSANLFDWAAQLQNGFASEIIISTYQDSEAHFDHTSINIEQVAKAQKLSYSHCEDLITSGPDIVVSAKGRQADLILMEGYRRIALGLWVEKHPLEDVLLHSETMVLAV